MNTKECSCWRNNHGKFIVPPPLSVSKKKYAKVCPQKRIRQIEIMYILLFYFPNRLWLGDQHLSRGSSNTMAENPRTATANNPIVPQLAVPSTNTPQQDKDIIS